MTLADTRLRRNLLRELTKRPIELTLLDVKVVAAIAYLTGEIKPIRGYELNVRKEREEIEEIVRSFPGVRGVVNEIKRVL